MPRDRKNLSGRHTLLLWLLLPVLIAAAAPVPAPDPDPEEREALLEARQTLRDRSAALLSEQSQLLFLKTMYSVESKYLLIDRLNGSIQLRYKDRLLKDIPFTIADDARLHELPAGVQVLTRKIDGKGRSQALIFGSALVIAARPSSRPPQHGGITLLLARKDLLSLLAALEEGAQAYLSR